MVTTRGMKKYKKHNIGIVHIHHTTFKHGEETLSNFVEVKIILSPI